MKKKLLFVFGAVLVLILLSALYVFLVFYPKYKKEKDTKDFYSDINSYSQVKSNLETFERSVSVFSQDNRDEATIEMFSEVKIDELIESLEEFKAELDDAQNIPDEVAFEVDNLKMEIDDALPLLNSLSDIYTYLSSLSKEANSFVTETGDFVNRIGEFNSSDLGDTIAQFNTIRAEFKDIFDKFNYNLSLIEISDRVKEFHGLIIADFTAYYTKVDSYFSEIDYLLNLIRRANENIYNLTQEELQKLKNIDTEFSNLQARAESLNEFQSSFETYDFTKIIATEEINKLSQTLTEIETNVEFLENYYKEIFK